MKSGKFVNVLKSKKLSVIVASVVLVITLDFTKVQAANIEARFNGVNRYETAAMVCKDGWQGDSDYAVIVNGENFPDALSAAPLAKKYDAPILLTTAEVLSPYTSSELNRLNVKNVFIIGGKGVVSQSIEDALKARNIKVTRVGGNNRYETSILVAQKLGKPTEIAVVNGDDFHDGLSIAPIAAHKGMPIILTGKDYIPSVVNKFFQSNKKLDQVYVVGDTNQINNDIENVVPNVKRIASGDVYERNTAVINAFQNELSTGTLYIASAKDFPDSLVAAAMAPRTASPILYVDYPMSLSTINLLKSKIVNNIKILGGTGAVDYNVEQLVQYLPLGVYDTNDITDTIWQGEKYTPRPTIVVTASDGSVKEVPITWNLTKINTSKPGIYTINGNIQGTYTNVVTTLIVKPLPVKVEDITDDVDSEDQYTFPTTVNAKMSDGSVTKVPVTWDYGKQQISVPGVYTFYGTVDKYSKKVKLTLLVKDDGSGDTPSNEFDHITIEIVQGEKYTLPKTVLDKITNKNLPVTWNTKSIDTDKTGVVRLVGTVSGSPYNAYLTLIVTPKIVEIQEIRQTVVQGDYYTLPTEVEAKISDGSIIDVPVTWNAPFIDLGTPQTYYIKGTVEHYDNPVTLILKVVSN